MGLVWSVTGQRAVVSSTTQPKHSLSGSMKRINLESSPCKRVEMSGVYSKDWPEVSRPYKTQLRLNPAKTSNCPRSSVISTLAQHLVARRSCIPKETRNVITFPPIVTLIYFKKTFNHLSQTKTAATIKKLIRKIMNILNQ